jgi:cell division protease FtsH
MGGRIAEEIMFSEMSTGASQDFKEATNLAKKMVTSYGMSEKLGPRTFGSKEEMVFLGKEIHEQRDYGEKTADLIDQEVEALIQNAYTTARTLLTENKARLVHIATKLMAEETLEGDELEKLFTEALPATAPTTPVTPPMLKTEQPVEKKIEPVLAPKEKPMEPGTATPAIAPA